MKFNRKKFRKIRKELRWTINRLAEAAKTSRQSISQWESGIRVPSEKKLRMLTDAMGISISEVSDIDASAPISSHNINKDINIHEHLAISEEKNYGDIALNAILKLKKKYQEVSLTLNALLFHANNIIYLKDINSKYVLANAEFTKLLGLNKDYNVNGKTDEDFFSNRDARENTEQDCNVIESGNAILNKEQHIPGTRKKRWGIVSKIPILDAESKIIAVLGIIVDITDRVLHEKYRKILEYAINKSNTTIWIAKGINRTDDYLFHNEVLFRKQGTPASFWGDKNPESYSYTEITKILLDSLTNETKETFKEDKKRFEFPFTRNYTAKSPFTHKIVCFKETIHFDKENETFIGFITEDEDEYKLRHFSEILNAIPNIIVWSGKFNMTHDKMEYSYISDTSKITGYYTDDFIKGNISFKILAEKADKDLFKSLYNSNQFPLNFNFFIKDKNGKKHNLNGNIHADYQRSRTGIPFLYGSYTDITNE